MSKGVKRVLGVAAAIAIPFAAPALASAIGLSGALSGAIGATAGSVAGGALTGAALGAATGAATGQDVGRSALMGGVGGGLGGFAQRPIPAATGTAPVGTGTVLAPPTGTGPLNTGYSAAPGAGLNLQSQLNQAAQLNVPAAAATSTPTFMQALKQVPGTIAGQFKDPNVLADMTLRAGGMLAGSALAGDGLSSTERRMLNEEVETLRGLQSTNEALFRERLEQARAMTGESKYFDPEYFGLQSARRAQVAGATAKRAGLRGLPEAQRTAESRRYDLDIGRNVGTAYDTGYGVGVQGRLGAMQAGLSAMPSERAMVSPATSAGLAGEQLRSERRRQTQEDVGTLFGSLTGRS
jgi:hypothetical protein